MFGIRDDLIAWGRLYMEPAEQTGEGIDEVVRSLTHESPQEESAQSEYLLAVTVPG